jgi:hypothetical protein
LRSLDFESSASASSATPAAERIVSHSQHSAQEEFARDASPDREKQDSKASSRKSDLIFALMGRV